MRHFSRSLTVGHVPLRLHYTWIGAILLGSTMLLTTTLPNLLPALDAPRRFILALGIVVLCIGVVLLHEAAHLLAAWRLGVAMQRVTLYPLGAITRLPDNTSEPRAALAVAAAGPIASIAIWLLILLFRWQVPSNWFTISLGIAGQVSLLVGLINLLPGLPLDGGRMLRALLLHLGGTLEWTTSLVRASGMVLAYATVLLGALVLARNLNWFWGSTLILLGWGLLEANNSFNRRALVARVLNRLTAADVAHAQPKMVTPDTTLRQSWEVICTQERHLPVAVVSGDTYRGLLTLERILEIPQGYWEERTAAEAMVPAEATQPVAPNTSVRMLLPRLLHEAEEQQLPVPVVHDGRLLGFVDTLAMAELLDLEAMFGTALYHLPGTPQQSSVRPAAPHTMQRHLDTTHTKVNRRIV